MSIPLGAIRAFMAALVFRAVGIIYREYRTPSGKERTQYIVRDWPYVGELLREIGKLEKKARRNEEA